MGDVAVAALAREAASLPYEEQVELLDALRVSVSSFGRRPKKRTHEENLALVKSFMGVSSCWRGEDILEYQRNLRGEYNG